ncbi:regulatory iron-sulfur-containing complex subunit RicT, partial [Selenomonas sp.]|uniref:regulatory iron-sulfur-containing complex subunit RicT n=1 Tax=Selenomonas sp. TaxID=2053611 RepID=UPI002A758A51
EAKLMGGMGCCGRPLCCATFLGEFVPVSIRMAKEQNLSLNPTKISGICGRLMCCLKYENDGYCNGVCCGQKRAVAHEPEQGSIVATMGGDGKVISVNQQRHTATILLNNGRTVVSSWDDIVERDPEELAAENAEGTEEAVLEQAQGGAEDVAASMQSRRPRRPQQNRRPPRRPRDKGERREWRENRSASGERPQDGKPRRPRRPRNNNRPRDRRPRDNQNGGNNGNHGEKNE